LASEGRRQTEWREIHNEELYDLYSSPNISVIKSGRTRKAGHTAGMGHGKGPYRVLVKEPEAKRPLRNPRRRCKGNNERDLEEVG